MSRIKLLLDVVTDLRSLADSLSALATAAFEDEPVPEAAPEVETQLPVPEPEKAPTLEEVRKVLATKSRDGYTAQVRELLVRHGAEKLSAIDPSEYAALLAEAEVLGDG